MRNRLRIERVASLPAGLEALVATSRSEGLRLVERLRADWLAGTNRFDEVGEALFAAREAGVLLGVCGLNRDPFANEADCGRVRRLYVMPDRRGRGVARALVAAVLAQAHGTFARVRVRTSDPRADGLYRSLGFTPLPSCPTASHELRLDGEAGRSPR